MAQEESWLRRSEVVLTVIAVLVAVVAYVVSKLVGS
jgi:hypothetical protein